jgi:hypothetical protein
MNNYKYTRMDERHVINSVGQRPKNRNRPKQALKERNQQDYAPLGLKGEGFISIIGRCPILMVMHFQGNKQTC